MNNSQGTSSKSGRKNIRKVLKDKQVADDTKQAAKEEEERLKRIMERQKLVRIFVCVYKYLSDSKITRCTLEIIYTYNILDIHFTSVITLILVQ